MKRKPIITILLAISCIVSGVILAYSPGTQKINHNAADDLDSLIVSHFVNNSVIGDNFRTYRIEVDTNFTRMVYRVPVPPAFSKTMFHMNLHSSLQKYDIETPARVIFPERNMNIYVHQDGIIRSTIRLITTEPEKKEENGE